MQNSVLEKMFHEWVQQQPIKSETAAQISTILDGYLVDLEIRQEIEISDLISQLVYECEKCAFDAGAHSTGNFMIEILKKGDEEKWQELQ